MTTAAGLIEITDIVMPDGRLLADISSLEDLLQREGLLSVWQDAGRIAAKKLGNVDADSHGEFQQERNCLFLQIVANGLEVGPLLAVWGLE